MGTIFRIYNKYAVKIIPGDHRPPHVHIVGAGCEAKFLISPLECYYVRGFSEKQIRDFERFLEDKIELMLETWNEINED